MNSLWTNLLSIWEETDRNARIGFAALAIGIVVLAIGFGIWAMRTDYQALFTDLDARDAAAIVEELRRMKVPYKVTESGTKILVEEKMVHETRLALMGRGVPISGGVGFEIFDNKDVGMTEYAQKINYQRALQGELARTILAINQVKQARVHLVVTESSIFKRQKVKPKASISLVLKPGQSLSSEQIVGIQRLVAAAVPNLESGAVTILDQRGVALSATMDGDEGFAAANGQFRIKKSAEDYFARKITEVLDRTFGPGQAIVSVDVTLNLDEIRRTQESIIPIRGSDSDEVGAVVRKRQSVYRQAKGPVTKAAVNGDALYAAGSPELNSTTEVEYEIGKSVEQVVTSPGGIRRLSVGIVVPKLNPDQISRIHSVVSMMVGFSESRGDAIAIQPIDQLLLSPQPDTIEVTPPSNAQAASTSHQRFLRVLKDPRVVVAAVVAVIMAMLLVWFRGRSRLRHAKSGTGALSETEREAKLAEIKALLASARNGERS